MNLKILSLNTQKAYNPNLESFLYRTLMEGTYDFIVLQEVTVDVFSMIRNIGEYKILDAFNEEVKAKSWLVILYRNSLLLKGHELYSFARMHPDPLMHYAGFGFLLGTFEIDSQIVQIGSVHLHPGVRPSVRAEEIKLLRKYAHKAHIIGASLIFGGDFNFGFPGELSNGCKLLTSEFVSATRSLGPTLNSRYSEFHPNIINRSAVFFAKFGLGISLRADHFFTDARTSKTFKITTRILPNRVSDHSPIELELEDI